MKNINGQVAKVFWIKKKKKTLIFSQMLVTFSFMAFGMFNMLKDFGVNGYMRG